MSVNLLELIGLRNLQRTAWFQGLFFKRIVRRLVCYTPKELYINSTAPRVHARAQDRITWAATNVSSNDVLLLGNLLAPSSAHCITVTFLCCEQACCIEILLNMGIFHLGKHQEEYVCATNEVMFALNQTAMVTNNLKFALDTNVDVPFTNIIGIVTKVWRSVGNTSNISLTLSSVRNAS